MNLKLMPPWKWRFWRPSCGGLFINWTHRNGYRHWSKVF